MKTRTIITAIASGILFAGCASTSTTPIQGRGASPENAKPKPHATRVLPTVLERKEIEKICAADRYMENGNGTKITLPEWKGFDTRRYTYTAQGTWANGRAVDVVMLNPTPDKAANWIINGIVDAHGSYDHASAVKLAAHISGQSHFQFPVAGIVVEEGLGKVFVFRDGVAVKLRGFNRRDSETLAIPENLTWIDREHQQYAISAPEADVESVGKQARPSSITMRQFVGHGEQWDRALLRRTYQGAFNSDRMPLVSKFAANHASDQDFCEDADCRKTCASIIRKQLGR